MAVPFVTDNYRDTEPPINWYPAGDQDFKIIQYGDPGLSTVVTPAVNTQVRCMKDMGEFLYVHAGNGVYQIDKLWQVKFLGNTLTNTGPSWIETNGVQVAVCDDHDMFVYTVATDTFNNVTATYSIGASCLTYQDGYGAFVNPNTGEFYLTNLYDFTTINLIYYGVVETWPGNLESIIMNYRELWLSKKDVTEFWFNQGGTQSNPFPFQRIGGPGMIPQGVGAKASVRRYDNGVIFLNNNREVLYFTGYQPQVISTPKMSREIETYSRIDDAIAFDYLISGHPFYCLTFPTAGVTWVWDNRVKAWHKRQSWQAGTVLPGRWRGNCAFYWNGMQLVGDYENGNIYQMSRDFDDDDGNYVIRTLYSQEIYNAGNRINLSSLRILFNHGGTTSNIDPFAMLSWSDDGGHTYGNEHWRSMGKVGEYKYESLWTRLGQARTSRIFKLQVSAKGRWDILSVDMVA